MVHILCWWLFALSAGAALEGRQPQLASRGNDVFVAFGRGDTILVAKSSDAGETFLPATIVATPGRLALGMRRGPRIAVTSAAVLVVAIAGERGGGADGDVLLWRSTDGGAQWSSTRVLNDVRGSAREGMHALAANQTGLVVAAWLDLRQAGTRIYATVSRDHGAGWGPNVLVYASPSGSVCECCHPSLAVADDGAIAVMFRNSVDGARDMYVTVSRDAGVTFGPARKQGAGTWTLKACPMDGGDVEWAGGRVVSAWRRDGQVFTSRDNGPEQLVADGLDPVMAVGGSHLDLVWSHPDGTGLRRAGQPMQRLGRGRSPTVLALPDRSVVAWEQGSQIQIQVVRY